MQASLHFSIYVLFVINTNHFLYFSVKGSFFNAMMIFLNFFFLSWYLFLPNDMVSGSCIFKIFSHSVIIWWGFSFSYYSTSANDSIVFSIAGIKFSHISSNEFSVLLNFLGGKYLACNLISIIIDDLCFCAFDDSLAWVYDQ